MGYEPIWTDKYRIQASLKYIYQTLADKGYSCEDIAKAVIRELIEYKQPLRIEFRRKFDLNTEYLVKAVRLGEVIKKWLKNVASCYQSLARVRKECPCVPSRTILSSAISIYRLKDIVGFLVENGCIGKEEFEELYKEMLKVCRS